MKSSKSSKKTKKNSANERRRRNAISISLKKLLLEEQISSKEKFGIYASNVSSSLKGKKSNYKPFRKKYIISNLLMESEKKDLIELYGDDDKEKYTILPLINFNRIADCSIMKYGARKSAIEIEYSYCKTCDYNSLKPICLSCINKCHYGHVVKFIFKKGFIKCSCGEKNHMIMKINYKKIYNMNCLCNEWNTTANLKYYYNNNYKEPICILCDYCCQFDKIKNNRIKLKKNKEIINCSCKNKDIHNDKRTMCEKLLNLISDYNDYSFLLHPVQFLNMIFKSKNSFKYIFEYFDFFVNDLNNSKDNSHIIDLLSKMRRIDVEFTNLYKTLIIFEKIVEKTRKYNIYFYHKEATKYFSFNFIKKLLGVLMHSSMEEKLFYQLTNKFLYHFHKTYLNEKTKLLNKFKLSDLKHLNYFIRISAIKENKKNFTESQSIITFLLEFFVYINNKSPAIIEAVHCIKEIISIFRKMSCYNLIKSYDMVKICSNVLESFNWIRNIKNYLFRNDQRDIKAKIDTYYFNNISIKALYVIIKTLQNFIYNYNDNILDMIIHNKKIYSNINDIRADNICFIFKKNELGELIFKLAIYILSILERNYKKVNNKRILLIKTLSIEIMQYALHTDDIYMLNIVDSFYKCHISYMQGGSKYYSYFLAHANNITNIFDQFFNFEKTLEETCNIINDILNTILDEDTIKNIESFNGDNVINIFNPEQKLVIYNTNFFSLIIKIIGIMNNYHKRISECEKKDSKDKNFNLNELIINIPSSLEEAILKKILSFSFSFVANSADFSFFILSHYIMKELVKLPEKYCLILFKLFFLCFKNIFESENHTIKSDSSFLIKRFYNYLNELMDNRDLKKNNSIELISCIYLFLQIMEISILNSEFSLFNDFIYKIQYLIIMVGKKYQLVQKYFELEYKENQENQEQPTNNEEEITMIKKTFSTYMRLVNNCFDFTIEEDRKKIKEIINVKDILFSLENYNMKINIETKTEFLRFIRKIMIDLKYSFKENNQYATAIINNIDNLKEIKDNSLLSYSNYPTRLLSFLKDMYSITAVCDLKEKLEEKSNDKMKTRTVKRNSNVRNWVIEKKGNKEINLSHEISDLGETKMEHSGFFEEYKNINNANNMGTIILENDNAYNIKHTQYLEGEFKKIPILRANNISKLLSYTEIQGQLKSNKLSVLVPQRKKLKNTYISNNERDIDQKDLDILKEIIKENNNEKLYIKSQELNLFEDVFNTRFYSIINNELDDILQKDIKLNNHEVIKSFRNYIENGILIPIIFYFKKIMVVINSFTGYEMIQLFSLLEKCLKLKIYLYENNYIWQYDKKPEKFNLFEHYKIFHFSRNNKESILDHNKFQKNKYFKSTKEFLDLIRNKKISLYDFSTLYQILEKELFGLIKERKTFSFNYGKNKDHYIDDIIINKTINAYEMYAKKENKEYNNTETNKRFLKSLIIYRHNKIKYSNENNSSFLNILSETNLEYELNFRNLLLSGLLHCDKNINTKNEFVTISYYLIFKLLLLQTEETQIEIANIINKENTCYINDVCNIFYNKIILSIIEYLNPDDRLIYPNYLISFYLLSIFRLLCAKDNKFFKLNFIQSISYKHISNIFYFFKNNHMIHNHVILEKSLFESSIYPDEGKQKTKAFIINGKESSREKTVNKQIKFYDFLLILIPKICMISNWDKTQKLPQDNFLFNLFSSIINLLSEIIHGNKNEILSLLFDDIIPTKEGRNFERIKKIEYFQNFVKNVMNILLDKKNSNELNIRVKKKINRLY